MQRDSIANILRVSLLLCLICSIGVSVAAVGLSTRQDQNKKLDEQKNVLMATGNFSAEEIAELSADEVKAEFEKNISTHYVRVGTDEEVSVSKLPEGENYDARAAVQSTKLQVRLPPEIAARLGIGAVAPYYAVYEVRKDGALDCYVLPIVGNGLWSTMYGFLALEPDKRTVRGINFYEHGETPGLGGEIDNPNWRAIWPGKIALSDEGEPIIDVIKGSVSPNDPRADHRVDGLAGATITANGVERAVNFWLSDAGFGKYLSSNP